MNCFVGDAVKITDLGRPVEPRLDVLINALAELAGRAEVDNFDRRPFGVAQEHVLGLQVAVDDVQLRRRQE